MSPAVFLDRDDTLIACNELPPPPPPGAKGDLVDPALVRLLPGVAEGLALLKEAGYWLVVVSNQGSVARGAATIEMVQGVNDRLQTLLGEACLAIRPRLTLPILDAVYFCPFHPKGNVPEYAREHPWRKPNPGMILAAAADLSLDLEQSWLIGDAQRDVEAAVRAGIVAGRALQVSTPEIPGFLDAVRRVLESGTRRARHDG
jgi:D-glycero-D-manno-heptose 1,7-bisphosphate phosphatase